MVPIAKQMPLFPRVDTPAGIGTFFLKKTVKKKNRSVNFMFNDKFDLMFCFII